MWLHKFLPQPCFDNAGPSGDSGATGGRSGAKGAEAGNNQRGGFSGGSTGTPGSAGNGGFGRDGIADTGRNQSNSFGGSNTISGNRVDRNNPTGFGTFGPATSAPAPARSNITSGPAQTTTRSTITPTIAAPTLAQLTSYTAPVTAQNAAVYGPAAMMSTPSTMSTLASAVAPVNDLVSRKQEQALSRPNMGPMDSPNTVSSSGYGSLADRAAQVNRDATRGLGMGPGGVGGVAPGNASGYGAVSGRNSGGGASVGGGGMGANNDGPSFSGGPQSNVAAKSDFGVPSLNTPSGTNLAGKSDFGVPSLGAPAGLLSRQDGMKISDDPADLSGFMASGFAPSQIGIAAANEAFANNPFSTAREQSFAVSPESARRASLNNAINRAAVDTALSKAGMRNAFGPTDVQNAQQAAIAQTQARIAAQEQRLNDIKSAAASRAFSEPDTDRTERNPYGTPATRDANAAQQAYGALNQQSLADSIANQNRAQQAQASTNAIRQGLLNQERNAQPQPASIPNAQPMPGGAPSVSIGPEFSRVQRAIDNFREWQRQAGLGGAATDPQGNPTTDPAANAAQEAINQEKATNPDGQKQATTPDFAINTDLAGSFRDRGTIDTVQGLVFHHTGGTGRQSPSEVAAGMGRKAVQFMIDRDGNVHQMTKQPNSRGAHTQDSAKNYRWSANNPRINNSNSIGVEIIAKNDADVTPAQAAAAAKLAAWASGQPWAADDFISVGHGMYQGDIGATEARLAGRLTRGQARQADEGRKAYRAWQTMSDAEKQTLRNMALSGELGGDIDEGVLEGLISGEMPENVDQTELAQVLQYAGINIDAIPDTSQQLPYSLTEEGLWSNSAQTFDNPIDAFKSMPLMDQLRAYIMWTRGGTPPPAGRDDTDRGGGEWRPPGLLSASMGNRVTQPGNDNAGGGGGGGPFVNGVGNWIPPGLLNRPYSNPFAYRNPWLNS